MYQFKIIELLPDHCESIKLLNIFLLIKTVLSYSQQTLEAKNKNFDFCILDSTVSFSITNSLYKYSFCNLNLKQQMQKLNTASGIFFVSELDIKELLTVFGVGVLGGNVDLLSVILTTDCLFLYPWAISLACKIMLIN